jgi:peptide deformylase
MPVRPVLRLPHDALSAICRPVGRVDDAALDLARDLVDTMRVSPACVGLAANQIGGRLRAVVVDVTGHPKGRSCHGLIVLFDPEVVEAGAPATAREGCMSVPDLTGDVARPERVTVAGLDLGGHRISVDADGLEARALLHEIDHLDGRLFLDRTVSPGAVFLRKVYRQGRGGPDRPPGEPRPP